MSEIGPDWARRAFESSADKIAEQLPEFSHYDARDGLMVLLVAVADDLNARALAVEQAKRRGWKSAAAELTAAAGHVGAYADAMRVFDPDADQPPAAVGDAEAVPRCAAFRRATPDDAVACGLARGHDGAHESMALDGETVDWPRRHSGTVCGDVLSMGGGAVMNCELPLGHDGDVHWSHADGQTGEGTTWPRGHNPRPCTPGVARPDVDYPGKDGELRSLTPNEPDDAASIEHPATESTPDAYPGMCGDREPTFEIDADACMLPTGHTGKHIGRNGGRWARAEAAALASVPTPRTATPAETMTAQLAQEVGSAVATLERPEPTEPDDAPLFGLLALGPIALPPITSGAVPALGIVSAAPRPTVSLLEVPGQPRARQSVSSITTMEDCGLKYRFTYRDQLPQLPAWWNVGGTAFHETVREIERDAEGMLPTDDAHAAAGESQFWHMGNLLEQQKAASGMFGRIFEQEIAKEETKSGVASQSWRAADKGKEDGAWWRGAGDDMVRAYVAQRAAWLEDWRLVKMLDGSPAQEVEFTHAFGTVELKGYIDDLWVNRADPRRVMVRDTKAGKRAPESDFQLEVYGEVVKSLPTELAFAAEPLIVTGTYYLARSARHTAAVPLGGNAEVITYRAEQVARADQAGIFMPRPSSFCGSCPFRSKCPVVK